MFVIAIYNLYHMSKSRIESYYANQEGLIMSETKIPYENEGMIYPDLIICNTGFSSDSVIYDNLQHLEVENFANFMNITKFTQMIHKIFNLNEKLKREQIFQQVQQIFESLSRNKDAFPGKTNIGKSKLLGEIFQKKFNLPFSQDQQIEGHTGHGSPHEHFYQIFVELFEALDNLPSSKLVSETGILLKNSPIIFLATPSLKIEITLSPTQSLNKFWQVEPYDQNFISLLFDVEILNFQVVDFKILEELIDNNYYQAILDDLGVELKAADNSEYENFINGGLVEKSELFSLPISQTAETDLEKIPQHKKPILLQIHYFLNQSLELSNFFNFYQPKNLWQESNLKKLNQSLFGSEDQQGDDDWVDDFSPNVDVIEDDFGGIIHGVNVFERTENKTLAVFDFNFKFSKNFSEKKNVLDIYSRDVYDQLAKRASKMSNLLSPYRLAKSDLIQNLNLATNLNFNSKLSILNLEIGGIAVPSLKSVKHSVKVSTFTSFQETCLQIQFSDAIKQYEKSSEHGIQLIFKLPKKFSISDYLKYVKDSVDNDTKHLAPLIRNFPRQKILKNFAKNSLETKLDHQINLYLNQENLLLSNRESVVKNLRSFETIKLEANKISQIDISVIENNYLHNVYFSRLNKKIKYLHRNYLTRKVL